MKDKYLQDLLAIQSKVETDAFVKKFPELSVGDRIAGFGVRMLLKSLAPRVLKKMDKMGIAPGAIISTPITKPSELAKGS